MKPVNVNKLYATLRDIAEREFSDIITFTDIIAEKLRLYLIDGSYVDIWFSRRLAGRYSYHWEHMHIRGEIHRHDNVPHKKWRYVETFPKHFHEGVEDNVKKSLLSDTPEKALREFLGFIRDYLRKHAISTDVK